MTTKKPPKSTDRMFKRLRKKMLKRKTKKDLWDEIYGKGDFAESKKKRKTYRRKRTLALLDTVTSIAKIGSLFKVK